MELQTIGAIVFISLNVIFVFLTKYFGFKIAFTKDNNGIAIGLPLMFGFIRTIFCLTTLFLCLKIFELKDKKLYLCVASIFLVQIVAMSLEIYSFQKLLGKKKTKAKSKILELISN